MSKRIMVYAVLFSLCGFVYSQKMTVNDSDSNILMEVNDEGKAGSITVPSGEAPSVTTNKLYSVKGSLYWNGSALGMAGSAGGWTASEGNVYTTTLTDKVGIGTSSPEFKLSLDDDGSILSKGAFGSGTVLSTSGLGTRLIWYARKAAFRAGYISGTQWDVSNIGEYSMAMGYDAMANGNFSDAFGLGTTAYGNYSTAMGYATTASGIHTTAMGSGTTAGSAFCMAIGSHNVGGGSADAWIDTDPIFEIGIGTSPSDTKNAVTVLKNGKVGIGTSSPEFKLSLDDDGSIISKGAFGSGTTLSTSGSGTKLIWYARKAAFRAGYISGTQWDVSNIGDYSMAVGSNTTAYNSYSTAMGYSTTASGEASTAMGNTTTASGASSTTMGDYTAASQFSCTAMGYSTTASAPISTAMGDNTTASGQASTAMGSYTTAESLSGMAIGTWNVGGGSSNTWIDTDPIFEIGIGTGTFATKNAVTVLKNGNVGIKSSNPGSALDVSGDIETGTNNAFYFGDPSTDNSWRIVRDGNNLVFQRREYGTWATKGTM